MMAVVTCASATEFPRAAFKQFLTQNCQDCHSGHTQEGGFDLKVLQGDIADPAVFERWERVFDRVNDGEMPPQDWRPPPAARKREFLRSLESSLTEVHRSTRGTVLRRLNRREYQNVMNDLFGTHLDLEERLPEDGRAADFDTVGSALGMSMVHLRKYIEAADAVIDAATAKTAQRPALQNVSASYATSREGKQFIGKFWKQLPDGAVAFFTRLGYPSGMLRGTEVRPPGIYKIRITGYAYRSDRPVTIRIGGTSFLRGSEKLTYGFAELPPGKPTTVELQTLIRNRYMIEIDPWGLSTGSYNIRKDGLKGYMGPGVAINNVELIGPIFESYPGRGHQLVYQDFVRTALARNKWKKEDTFKLESKSPEQSARRTLLRIAESAFRRPVKTAEVARYVDLFQQQLQAGADMEGALRTSVTALFCSPDFLYLNEPEGPLGDHAIASRLSFFLTRTSPDAALRRAADEGRLAGNSKELLAQTRRLLADPNNERFVTDFCDGWLNLKDIDFTSPDRKLFPEFDQYLQHSMLRETRQFVARLIHDNLPVSNIVVSEFAMLNERLAEHYGIENVEGPHIRPVQLPTNSLRGGLLSQGSILKVSANGTNTSPVVRGVWVMDRILGQHPQPPPPGIPGVEPDIRGATTLRELLEKHRDVESCRSCHAAIDPPGFALECFNPIGGYRERFRSLGDGDRVDVQVDGRRVGYRLGLPVDASGRLPDGTAFQDYAEFRSLMVRDPEVLAKSLTSRLLTFASGREMGFSDRRVVADIVKRAESGGYRVRDLIELAVTSEVFLQK